MHLLLGSSLREKCSSIDLRKRLLLPGTAAATRPQTYCCESRSDRNRPRAPRHSRAFRTCASQYRAKATPEPDEDRARSPPETLVAPRPFRPRRDLPRPSEGTTRHHPSSPRTGRQDAPTKIPARHSFCDRRSPALTLEDFGIGPRHVSNPQLTATRELASSITRPPKRRGEEEKV